MTDAAPDRRRTAPLPLGSRVIGMLLSPRRTSASVIAYGQWLDVLTLTTLVSSAALALFLTTSVGRQAWVDQVVGSIESWGVTLDDQTYARLEDRAAVARFVNPAALLIVTPLMTALVAAVLVAVCNAWLGARATLRQGLALVAHGGIITMIQHLVTMPHNFFKETLSAPTNLGVYFPTLSDTGFLATLLGAIDLFVVWRMLVLAIGLAVLYGSTTLRLAVALLSAYGAIGLLIAATKTVFTGGA
jgi:hypothetical protein